MAKNIHPVIQLQGKLGGLVFVNSKAYAPHVRMPRGSKKKAGINPSLAGNVRKLKIINRAARQVHDLVKVFAADFKEKRLWQKIVGRMFPGKSNKFIDLLSNLEGLELNAAYPLERFGGLPALNIENAKQKLVVHLKSAAPPFLSKPNDCYQYILTCLFFPYNTMESGYITAATGWLNGQVQAGEQVFQFVKPPKARYYLLCLGLECGKNQTATDTLAAKGMLFIKADTLKIKG